MSHPQLISLWERMQGVQCWRGNGLRKMPIKVPVGCCPSAKTMFILNQIRYLCFSVSRHQAITALQTHKLSPSQLLQALLSFAITHTALGPPAVYQAACICAQELQKCPLTLFSSFPKALLLQSHCPLCVLPLISTFSFTCKLSSSFSVYLV